MEKKFQCSTEYWYTSGKPLRTAWSRVTLITRILIISFGVEMDRWLASSNPGIGAPKPKLMRIDEGPISHSIEVLPELNESQVMHRRKPFSLLQKRPVFSRKSPYMTQFGIPRDCYIGSRSIQQWNGHNILRSTGQLTSVESIDSCPYFAIGTDSGQVELINARTRDDENNGLLVGRSVCETNLKSVCGAVGGLASVNSDKTLLCATEHSICALDTSNFLLSGEFTPDVGCFGSSISANKWTPSLSAVSSTSGNIMLLDVYSKDLSTVVKSAHGLPWSPISSISSMEWVDQYTLCSVGKHVGAVKFWDTRKGSRPIQSVSIPNSPMWCFCGNHSVVSDGTRSVWCLTCDGRTLKMNPNSPVPEYEIKLKNVNTLTHGLAYVPSEWPQLVCGGSRLSCVSVPSTESDQLNVNSTRAVALENPHYLDSEAHIKLVKWNPYSESLFSGADSGSWRIWTQGRRRTGRPVRTRMRAITQMI